MAKDSIEKRETGYYVIRAVSPSTRLSRPS